MRLVRRAQLYARTLSPLRWEQWLYRPVRRLQRRAPAVATVAVRLRSEPRLAALTAEVVAWGPPLGDTTLARADEILVGRFTFLNHTEELAAIRWRQRYVSHLWNYNLHYFDHALDLAWATRITGDRRYADRFVALATSWIEEMHGSSGDGWEPYAASLRVVNWSYALLLLGDAVEPGARARIVSSLALQLDFLSRRLEFHLLANHLQKNLKALVVGGLLFEGERAERWLRRGSRLLWRELREQVLPDGMHYERSPMYHAICLGDHLELVALLRAAGEEVPNSAVAQVRNMVRALSVVSTQSDRLHLFNDTAEGIAPPVPWLFALSSRTLGEGAPSREGLLELPYAGYFGYSNAAQGEQLLVDCGALGPRYQSAHGHCDVLSFEWYHAGRAVVIDSGVSGYDGDPLREYVRSTRAHNTVSLDRGEQAELWGTFRVARVPTAIQATHGMTAEGYQLDGEYHPYFDQGVVHHRSIERRPTALSVVDHVRGAAGRPLRSYLHLHPDFDIAVHDGACLATAGDLQVRIEHWGFDRVDVVRGATNPVQGWYCPEFGIREPAPVLVFSAAEPASGGFGYRLMITGFGQDAGHSSENDNSSRHANTES